MSISTTRTMRARRDSKNKKFDVGPASPSAGPMFDIADIAPLIDSLNGAPVAVMSKVPNSVIAKNVVRKPMIRCTLSGGTGAWPNLTGTMPDG